MNDFTNRIVLVTGAGSGIGRATARAFALRGARILAVGPSTTGLAETRALVVADGGRCDTYVADVSNEVSMQALAEVVTREYGALDVLVNNAGIGAAGRFLDTSPDTWERVWAVNVKGVMLGCKLFLPAMIARGRGHVVNVSSMAGYFASPEMPVYATSKSAVIGFSESLRADLADKGIGVTAICPGIVNTNIIATTTTEGSAAAWQSNAVDFYRKRNYPPSRVAKAIVRAVERNGAIVPVTPEAWWGYHLKRLLPGAARSLAARPLPFMKTP
ncbi:MAG TPA: SDR family NAD(P)-dependent oxidoreductase [Nevskiaceae bacterium]|nr:SDR family NAD(P)-dependent oxidoreductase [Nevskiaceae bacterium]